MVHNILKNLVVSTIFLLIIACESPVGTGMSTHEHVTGNVTVIMPSIPRIELNDYTWQTLVTVYGLLESDNIDVENMRVEWSSDMFWVVHDSAGYFKLDCRTCVNGTWYDSDGTTEPMTYNFHTMAPVTNQVSLADATGEFGNVLAPVRSMVGRSMWLWWSIIGTVVDSMSIFLME